MYEPPGFRYNKASIVAKPSLRDNRCFGENLLEV